MIGNKKVNNYLPPSLSRMTSASPSRPTPSSLRHILNDAPSTSWNESGSKINCASVREKVTVTLKSHPMGIHDNFTLIPMTIKRTAVYW